MLREQGMRVWKFTAALLAASALALPAAAQDGLSDHQKTEMYCVYDVLSQSDDIYDIADVFVDENAKDEEIKAADALLNDAVDECLDVYDWDDEVQELAALIGIHGSVVDVLTSDLSDEGLKEDEIEAIFAVLDDLDDEDLDTFSDPAWLGNAAFQSRMDESLVDAGLPDDAYVLETSRLVMESSILAAQALVDWMDLTGATKTAAADAGKGDNSKKKKTKKAGNVANTELAATGTGFYIAPEGYLVTNAHVVEGCRKMTLHSGAPLEIVDVQADEDLALLKGEGSVRPLTVRDGRGVRLAEDVLVAGFPLGGILSSGINVTVGTVSALDGLGDDDRRFQFTAPVQPGNSGGPVLDMAGNVIGVVVSKLDAMSVQKETGDIPQNVNFGIKLTNLTAFLNANHVSYEKRASSEKMDKVDMAEMARASTVLLECYQ